jgi:aldehyde dehydrogenase (NAD+)
MAKPSEKTPHTSALLKKMIEAIFPTNEVAVIEGGLETSQVLLDIAYDHIFFTGSINVGKVVMAAAAKHLTSVTLELGGKSPVIIDREVDLELAVERIAWGKLLNGGQTCVAPDYVFVPAELKDQFVELFKKYYDLKYKGDNNFTRLIDTKAFERLHQKIEREENLLGGSHSPEDNFLAPQLIHTHLQSAIMEDEIFGPILPLITYTKIEEVIDNIRAQSKPLSLYVFSTNKTFIKNIIGQTTSGGVGVNQVILHLANPHLPFGGVGFSGQGSYHGIFGFKAFSHEKAVIRQGKWSLIKMYFPPYNTWWSKMAFKLLQFLE